MWQVAGLAFLWYVGSPQSKEGDDRKEEILTLLLKKVDPENADRLIKELERKYPKVASVHRKCRGHQAELCRDVHGTFDNET
jgi:hypothetical protein